MHHIQERDPRFDDPFLSGFRVRFHQYTQTMSIKNIYSYIFIMIQPFYLFFAFIIALLLAPSAFALPNGFIDEAVGRMQGTSGTFVPNPRQNGKPMMLVVSIEGLIFAIEDPDNAGPRLQIADMRPIICNNGPHGILNIEPHPDLPPIDSYSSTTHVSSRIVPKIQYSARPIVCQDLPSTLRHYN